MFWRKKDSSNQQLTDMKQIHVWEEEGKRMKEIGKLMEEHYVLLKNRCLQLNREGYIYTFTRKQIMYTMVWGKGMRLYATIRGDETLLASTVGRENSRESVSLGILIEVSGLNDKEKEKIKQLMFSVCGDLLQQVNKRKKELLLSEKKAEQKKAAKRRYLLRHL